MNKKTRLTELAQKLSEPPKSTEAKPRSLVGKKSENTDSSISEKRKTKKTALRISEKQKSEKRKDIKSRKKADFEANPPHGEKGDFVKITVTLPPAVYQLINDEAVRRKIAKERDAVMAAIIREAVVEKLGGK